MGRFSGLFVSVIHTNKSQILRDTHAENFGTEQLSDSATVASVVSLVIAVRKAVVGGRYCALYETWSEQKLHGLRGSVTFRNLASYI